MKGFVCWLGVTLAGHGLAAQSGVLRGHVRARAGQAAVSGALVRLRQAGQQGLSGHDGAFVLAWPIHPDTVIVTAIGFLPDTIPLTDVFADTLTVSLREAPLWLSDLVSGATATGLLASGESGPWHVAGNALAALPAAVEPDVNRALALVPGVSFSSLLSARPLLRGLNADDGSYAIDGFEAINLYHIGRFFSAMPGLAVDHVDVRFMPESADLGGTTAGQVNVVGRPGTHPGSGDVEYGLGALSASAGAASADGHSSLFVTGRTVETSLLNQVLSDQHVQYDFNDLYAKAQADPLGVPATVSLFTSADNVTPEPAVANPTDATMHWTNTLVGIRTDLVQRPGLAIAASVAYARHFEQSRQIPARGNLVDVLNDLSTITAQLSGGAELGRRFTARFGMMALDRNLKNDITPAVPSSVLRIAESAQRVEPSGYGDLEFHAAALTATAGVRVDHADSATVVQPRLALRLAGRHESWLSLSVGRSARLFHVVSDARSEPKYSYYDFWLLAGTHGIPAATMTSAALSGAGSIGRVRMRVDLYGSLGDGEVDLKPQLTPSEAGSIFREGRSRVRGADVSAITDDAAGRWSFAASYGYSVSERDWGEGWVPWVNDRRHEVRLVGLRRVGRSLRLATSIDLQSALPFTPIASWYLPSVPGGVREVDGPEMSGRGLPWLRIDASIVKQFAGPWHSRWEAGLSIGNVSLGDQAARTDSLEYHPPTQTWSAQQAPLFRLPVVPSLLIRASFGAPR